MQCEEKNNANDILSLVLLCDIVQDPVIKGKRGKAFTKLHIFMYLLCLGMDLAAIIEPSESCIVLSSAFVDPATFRTSNHRS
jgi:hypothetical protein